MEKWIYFRAREKTKKLCNHLDPFVHIFNSCKIHKTSALSADFAETRTFLCIPTTSLCRSTWKANLECVSCDLMFLLCRFFLPFHRATLWLCIIDDVECLEGEVVRWKRILHKIFTIFNSHDEAEKRVEFIANFQLDHIHRYSLPRKDSIKVFAFLSIWFLFKTLKSCTISFDETFLLRNGNLFTFNFHEN